MGRRVRRRISLDRDSEIAFSFGRSHDESGAREINKRDSWVVIRGSYGNDGSWTIPKHVLDVV